MNEHTWSTVQYVYILLVVALILYPENGPSIYKDVCTIVLASIGAAVMAAHIIGWA